MTGQKWRMRLGMEHTESVIGKEYVKYKESFPGAIQGITHWSVPEKGKR